MDMKRAGWLLPGLIVFVVVAMLSVGNERPILAVTPPPPGPGLPHSLHVINPEGGPVPEGWRVGLINAEVRPPASLDEVRAARQREPCADVPIKDGFAEIVPVFDNPDCPEGTRVVVTVLTGPNVGFAAEAKPAIEWRRAMPGEQLRVVRVEMVPPNTGDSTAPLIVPPGTGDAGLR